MVGLKLGLDDFKELKSWNAVSGGGDGWEPLRTLRTFQTLYAEILERNPFQMHPAYLSVYSVHSFLQIYHI